MRLPMRIFIDDIRDPKDGREWTVVRTYDEAIAAIIPNLGLITEISFDHDLGQGDGKEGYDVASAIERHVHDQCLTNVPVLHVHSRNPAGRERLQLVFDSIFRIALSNETK